MCVCGWQIQIDFLYTASCIWSKKAHPKLLSDSLALEVFGFSIIPQIFDIIRRLFIGYSIISTGLCILFNVTFSSSIDTFCHKSVIFSRFSVWEGMAFRKTDLPQFRQNTTTFLLKSPCQLQAI